MTATVVAPLLTPPRSNVASLEDLIPEEWRGFREAQSAIPDLAKNPDATAFIESQLARLQTGHELRLGDARDTSLYQPGSVHLVLTSPPYWTLKEYPETEGQLGWTADYEDFLSELAEVWRNCFDALVPGGRLICVVGDVCLSRRRNRGRHMVIPLHASIQEQCREIGFDNLAPIIWHKIGNISYEMAGRAGSFLGKPYEPNAIIKNDIEYILMLRKPGGYRKPSFAARLLSLIPKERHETWFQQVWTGLAGASTRDHPAPYPLELAERLIRMFSFAGDTVLDPFAGTGTTLLAAANWGRCSVGIEIEPSYTAYAERRIRNQGIPNIQVRD